jgi:hypothetical protein
MIDGLIRLTTGISTGTGTGTWNLVLVLVPVLRVVSLV